MRKRRRLSLFRSAAAATALLACMVGNAAASPPWPDLSELALEDLLKIEVTLASRKKEMLSDVAGAAFVVTAEDIRRSGATSIADALRMVPGLQVGRIDANRWAITGRGFSGEFVNKLLVLVDGRTVYSPTFSGVYWDVQDLFLDDVDRIEVIRGPGAALWGANAVNGVINVVTKSAQQTQGGLVTAGGGTEERAFGGARYGWSTAGGASWRLFGKYFDKDSGKALDGSQGDDGWNSGRAGFRGDWNGGSENRFALMGEAYRGEAGASFEEPTLAPPYSVVRRAETRLSGGHLLGRWSRALSSGSELSAQTYYDRTFRDDPFLIRETRDTFDVDVQHRIALTEGHDVVWGLGYRGTRDQTEAGETSSLEPASRWDQLWSAFVQDHLTLVPEALRAVLACKFERNGYTGFEAQPTARLIWTPDSRQALWAAASRAVRTPSRGEADGRSELATVPPGTAENPGPLPVLVQIQADSQFSSEKLLAFEAGYRLVPTPALSFDLASFYNRYTDLRTTMLGAQTVASDFSHVVQAVSLRNKMSGNGYGAELAADWRVTEWWRLLAAYTYTILDLKAEGGGLPREEAPLEGGSPKHQVSLRSQADLPWELQLDLWLRYASRLWATKEPAVVGEYVTLDVRLGWRPTQHLELSVVGQNLLTASHLEAAREIGRVSGVVATQVEPGVYGKAMWYF